MTATECLFRFGMWECWLSRALIDRDLGRTASPAGTESGIMEKSFGIMWGTRSVEKQSAFNENTKAKEMEREKRVVEINKTVRVRTNQSAELLEQHFSVSEYPASAYKTFISAPA